MKRDPARVVVIGSGGRLGAALLSLLEPEFDVTGLDRRDLDLASARSIRASLDPLNYDFLFLTGALTAVDYCETHEDEAFAVNAAGPGTIAQISAAKAAHVTYISTDLVFDGRKDTPYIEADEAKPLSVYGASKLEGEERILAASPGNLVARVSWLYGPDRPAFPEWVIDRACQETHLTLPDNKICCPTYTVDLAAWLAALVLMPASRPAQGVFHLCNSSPCSWLEWGRFTIKAAREAGFPIVAAEITGVPVDSIPAFVAKRPLNTAMDTHKFSARTGIRPRHWSEPLRDFVIQSAPLAK